MTAHASQPVQRPPPRSYLQTWASSRAGNITHCVKPQQPCPLIRTLPSIYGLDGQQSRAELCPSEGSRYYSTSSRSRYIYPRTCCRLPEWLVQVPYLQVYSTSRPSSTHGLRTEMRILSAIPTRVNAAGNMSCLQAMTKADMSGDQYVTSIKWTTALTHSKLISDKLRHPTCATATKCQALAHA